MPEDFTQYTHEQMVAMLHNAGGLSIGFTSVGMKEVADNVRVATDSVKGAMASMTWEGDSGQAFGDWVSGLLTAAYSFADYSTATSTKLLAVGQQISTAVAQMPPLPPASVQVTAKDPTQPAQAVAAQKELDGQHAEAARVMSALASTYEVNTSDLNSTQPPTFPLPPNSRAVPVVDASEETPIPTDGLTTSPPHRPQGGNFVSRPHSTSVPPGSASPTYASPTSTASVSPQSSPSSTDLLSNGGLTASTSTWRGPQSPPGATPTPTLFRSPGGQSASAPPQFFPPGVTGGVPVDPVYATSPYGSSPSRGGIYGGEPSAAPEQTPPAQGNSAFTAGDEPVASSGAAAESAPQPSRGSGYGFPGAAAGGERAERGKRKRASYLREDTESWAADVSSIVPPVIG